MNKNEILSVKDFDSITDETFLTLKFEILLRRDGF